MKKYIAKTLICGWLILFTAIAAQGQNPLEGRWNITVQENGKPFPNWLEVYHSGINTLVGQYVGIVGSARPISKIEYADGNFSFSIPPQWESTPGHIRMVGTVTGDKISGIIFNSNGTESSWTGVRAPELRHTGPVKWGKPIELFNGRNLDGWQATGANQWTVANGILTSPKSGANLYTVRNFDDFKLNVEFRIPPGSNSGIYLRGRYEVQIIDSKGQRPARDLFGAIYGFIIPSEMAARAAGEWQQYEITLRGRMVTIKANGKTIVTNQEIPGITGGAIDSHEGEPGPIYLQGDHGPVEFRKITLTPAL